MKTNSLAKDETGNRYGRLIVLERVERPIDAKNSQAYWLCRCDCGKIITVSGPNLRRGSVKSCGCYAREQSKIRETKHGYSRTALYRAFRHAKLRCEDEKDPQYNVYGATGIKFCFDSVADAVAYGYSIGYKDGLTLDRIDPNGNYEPGNIRFVDMKTQNNNRRNNFRIEYKGKIMTLTQWSE